MMARPANVGRHDLARVPEPIAGYPELASSVNNTRKTVGLVAIADPYDPRKRVRAIARFDLLDRERKAGRLDEGAYLAGREVERVFEAMHATGAGAWFDADRIDGGGAAELKAVLGLERARFVNSFLGWLVHHLGRSDTRLLWAILGERRPYAAVAAALWPGKSAVRALRYTIDRFCDALAILADARSAKGRQSRREAR